MSYINLEHGRSNSTNGRTKSTISCWVKRSGLGSMQYIWGWGENNSSDAYCRFDAADNLEMHCDGAGGTYNTTTLYRDVNGWMHIVFSIYGSNATANLRRRLWINGVQIDEGFGSTSTFSAAVQGDVATQDLWIGANPRSQQSSSIAHFDGYISHFHYCDGYSYAASDFGETDATTGEWKLKTAPSVSYGDNGIFCKMEDSSNIDLDSGSNNITLSTSGTVTPVKDNPSNVFATLNRLYKGQNNLTLSLGNTKAVEGADNWRTTYSSLGASSGKFYCEAKVTYQNNTEAYVGVAHEDHINGLATFGGSWGGVQNEGYDYVGYSNKSVSIYSTGDQDYPSTVNVGDTWQSSGDIMSIAMDLDNNKVYFAKNGVWADGSGGWGSSTFDSSVGGQTIVSGLTHFGFSPNQSTFEVNFGNGYFGTTAVATAGTNASNIGTFEYNVPTGYTALCTKGLNE